MWDVLIWVISFQKHLIIPDQLLECDEIDTNNGKGQKHVAFQLLQELQKGDAQQRQDYEDKTRRLARRKLNRWVIQTSIC